MTDTIFKPGEYVTRDGRKARVYATDGWGAFPIHGAVTHNGQWALQKWTVNGKWTEHRDAHGWDLMPPKQVRYVNMYSEMHMTRQQADESADETRIACIRIEFTEGQYDD